MTVKNISMGGNRVKLHEFNLKKLFYSRNGSGKKEPEYPRIAMIAKSNSGKSWVTRDIIYHGRHIPTGIVIAPTDRMNGFYNDIFLSGFIYHEYKETIIPKVLGRQLKIIEENKERKAMGKREKNPACWLIMDDCMSSKHMWLKDPKMLAIFNEGRHYKIIFILTMQYCLGIQPELRSNFDWIFLLTEDFKTNRKKLYDHYAGMFPSLDIFEQVFSQLTANYGCMIINNKCRDPDITKKIFWFKAKERKNFIVGDRHTRKYHHKWYDPEYRKRSSIVDLNEIAMASRSKKINITVDKV